MFWSDDPVWDAERYEAEREENYRSWLSQRPKCAICGEPIEEDYAVHLYEEWFCDDCLGNARSRIPDWEDA